MRDAELGAALAQEQLRAINELIGSLAELYPEEVSRIRAAAAETPPTTVHSPNSFAAALVRLVVLMNRRLDEHISTTKARPRGRPRKESA